ncbi:FMN-binding protein [Vulgatibacter sp.]|uniref:FMN-binding protein n=1 Tax=Vulgatibacter sp. TaxID=1971226 RepID=UPI003562B993
MRSLLKFVLPSLLAFTLLTPSVGAAEELVSFKEGAKRMLSGAKKASKLDVTPTDEEKAKIKGMGVNPDATYSFLIGKDEAGAPVAAGIVVDQAGKEGPMRVGVALDPANGKVKEAFVMRFEEERGKPVKEASFLGQFKGKGPSDAITGGKDIDIVSGATHSSKAVAEAVKRAVASYKVLVLDRGTK